MQIPHSIRTKLDSLLGDSLMAIAALMSEGECLEMSSTSQGLRVTVSNVENGVLLSYTRVLSRDVFSPAPKRAGWLSTHLPELARLFAYAGSYNEAVLRQMLTENPASESPKSMA